MAVTVPVTESEMPYESPKQARLMRAVEHGWHKPGGGGPSVKVAKEFAAADKANPSGYAAGGMVMDKVTRHNNAAYARGGSVQAAPAKSFSKSAEGDAKLKDRKFLKEESPYNTGHTPQDYEDGRKDAIHSAGDKSRAPIMPRG
jgi:hypothetical protein